MEYAQLTGGVGEPSPYTALGGLMSVACGRLSYTFGYGRADIARHVIDTHSEPSCIELIGVPMTWRAISARPYLRVGRRELLHRHRVLLRTCCCAPRRRQSFQREPRADSGRRVGPGRYCPCHVIDPRNAFRSLVSRVKLHPMTWRAISAGPYGRVQRHATPVDVRDVCCGGHAGARRPLQDARRSRER
jgi:hypothetical protein